MNIRRTITLFIILFSFGIQAGPKVIINEACIVPQKETYPKWVELKSCTEKSIDMKGYSLHDRERCIFRFTEEYIVKPRECILLCFYEGNEISREFNGILEKDVIPVNIFNAEIFKPREIIPLPRNFIELFGNQYGNIDIIMEVIPSSNYLDKFEKQAVKYLKENNIPVTDKNKNAVIDVYVITPPYFDELSLLDSEGNLMSFINWGNQNLNREAVSKNARKAEELKIWEQGEPISVRIYNGTYSPMKNQPIIFEENSEYTFGVSNPYYSSPGKAYSKAGFIWLLLKIDFVKKILSLAYFEIDSSFPWGIELELSKDKEFKEIFFAKKILFDPKTNFWEKASVKLEDEDIRIIKEHKGKFIYYRARRTFHDGCCSTWISKKAERISRWKADGWSTFFEKDEYIDNSKIPTIPIN